MSRCRSPKCDARQGRKPGREKAYPAGAGWCAHPGEVANCAVKLFALLRKRKATPEQLQTGIAGAKSGAAGNSRIRRSPAAIREVCRGQAARGGPRLSAVGSSNNCRKRAPKTCVAIVPSWHSRRVLRRNPEMSIQIWNRVLEDTTSLIVARRSFY